MRLAIARVTSVFLAVGVMTTACRPRPERSEARSMEAEAGPEPSAISQESAPSRAKWVRTRPDQLSERGKATLEQAKRAQKALGSTLMGELTSAVEKGDFARGVEVCKEAAPRVQARVSADHRVELGRTSFKVRNPNNRPPAWAEPYVQARAKEDVILTRSDGELAYLSPIIMGELCTKCHGTAAQMPDDVRRMIADKYPEDEATGFQAGDLRGWFWVRSAGR